MRDELHDIRDGLGAWRIVEVTVRVLVGTERSTVIVSRGWDPVTMRDVREHGH